MSVILCAYVWRTIPKRLDGPNNLEIISISAVAVYVNLIIMLYLMLYYVIFNESS